jgi:hypothetical protein
MINEFLQIWFLRITLVVFYLPLLVTTRNKEEYNKNWKIAIKDPIGKIETEKTK